MTQIDQAITPEHFRRCAVIYMRQSTPEQVQKNSGSTQYQRSLSEVARSYGWSDSQIQIIDDDLGKSGSSIQGRTGWQRLQSMIEAHQVGAVFVANVSRLSRQLVDFELFRLRAALHNTLLYIDGRFINPADSHDAILSQITAMVAQFENRKRVEIMAGARLAKAKRGEAVSRLPVGWIKTPDGNFDYDPQVKDTIHLVIETFWQTRSIYQTVKALAKAGVQLPYKNGQRIHFTKPTWIQVKTILTDAAYGGTYVFGKSRAQPGGPVLASGQSKRIKVPENRWIKIFNHHPAYLRQEQQEEIKTILKNNFSVRSYGVARLRALTQGLLRCAVCGARLSVSYPSKGYSFSCSGATQYAEKPCMSFKSDDLDECILREVFKVLKTPPIEMLKSTLKESRTKTQTRLSWIASERKRLSHERQSAQERADLTCGGLPSVHFDALEKLEKVIQEINRFEQNISAEQITSPNDCSEKELEELCRIAGDVPGLWQHETVTHQERKDILRCVIEYIVVGATNERIDATIFWNSGAATSVYVWRRPGRHHLIRELHAQKLTVREIKEHLAAGKTSTGQVVKISFNRLYFIMHSMGLKLHQFSLGCLALRHKAAELYRAGRSKVWIAQHFKRLGLASASGKPWTPDMVSGLLHTMGEKPKPLKDLYRRLIAEALARGLDFQQIARQFNKKRIRLCGRPPWTERKIARTWNELSRPREPMERKLVKHGQEEAA